MMMTTMLNLLKSVDFYAGLGALAWAIAASYLPELAKLASPEAAFVLSTAAFTRAMAGARKAAKLPAAE